MKVYENTKNLNFRNPVVTMGTFDGIHLGHFSVIQVMKERAKEINGETVLLTFWPHPRIVISENPNIISLLNTLDEKITLFEKSGLDNLIVFPFTKDIAKLTSKEFVAKYLVEEIGVEHLVFGYDHQFGKNREGSFESLQQYSNEFNFTLEQVPAFSIRGENISSTKIRKLISEGNLLRAREYLGYNYYLKGKVTSGMKLGRKIGYPTANIDFGNNIKLLPPIGVYAVNLKLANNIYNGMMNIGFKPTVSSSKENISAEVHIFNFNKDIYNEYVEIEFIEKIREEKKFDSLALLVKQLEKDKLMAQKIIENQTSDFFS